MAMKKWTTVSVSVETIEFLEKIKKAYGVSKTYAVENALKEKYGHLTNEVEKGD